MLVQSGSKTALFFLFVVSRVATQPRRIFLQFQLFTARFATNRVIVVAGFLANEEQCFPLLFPATTFFLGHLYVSTDLCILLTATRGTEHFSDQEQPW